MDLKKVQQAGTEMYFEMDFEGEPLTLYACSSFGYVDYGVAQKHWDVRARNGETKKALGSILETITQEKLAKLKEIGKTGAFSYQAELLMDFDRYSADDISRMVQLLGKIKKMHDGVVTVGKRKLYMVPTGTKNGTKVLYWIVMKGATPTIFEANATWVTIAKMLLQKRAVLAGRHVSVSSFWDLLKIRHGAKNAESVLKQFGSRAYNAVAAEFLIGKDGKPDL